ncbi:response regulator transcription factor [Larsenimonas rhizosphaerae]|uniref:Response regulator transcription factor n=1 Tax=Larsenimonas rhizosphaerae TaxID=2944682 RepID=A0AA41ZER3_9GAMM|nr:response regulator transcription factor [Larsenimonas rhizosphaerae]MCM2129285.1 response regulator transcription factor [Larsenimonas rhizosphaerae]MCX2523937.1 response regulator transcription factor [Larsenimonas rhizosphaerae]
MKTIIMVTLDNPQNELFLEYLRTELDCSAYSMEPGQLDLESVSDTPVLVLLDQDYVDDDIARQWSQHAQQNEQFIMAGFNLDTEEDAVKLMMRFPLQGVFYRRDPLKMISKGVNILFTGEMWLSRALMEKLLSAYWYRQRSESAPFKSLTRREMEILQLLKTGASNHDIAQQLAISEHTVKSHLYHIFRKLKVRNRAQALNLLREQLDAAF